MKARVGDGIVIDGHQVGEPKRTGEIVEVRGEDGAPPYRVKWDDSGRTTLLFPGFDCHIEPVGDEESAGSAS